MRTSLLFADFMQRVIADLERNRQVRTAETYRTTLNSFNRFLDGKQLLLKNITPQLIEQYELWLMHQGVTRNSSSFYMRILRSTYNRAVDKGYVRQQDPFRHVYTGVDKTVKRAMPLGLIRKVKDLDLSAEPHLAYARDLFMFSFYTRGMSFVDMAFLKKTDIRDGVLNYARQKTGQLLHIKWEPCMQAIVDRYAENPTGYLLPIITDPVKDPRKQYKNRIFAVNTALHLISDRLKTPFPLTTYVARHSWASIAYAKNIPLSVITEGMGHDSERTTRIYLASLSNARVDRANSKIISLL